MRLYLVQHGNAVAKTVDPDRPLSETGAVDVTRLAAFLRTSCVRVQRIVHSGKSRAQQTAERLAVLLQPDEHIESLAGLGPNDPVTVFAQQAGGWQEDTLVVGHLPFLGRLVSWLVTGNEESAVIGYQPGSIVCLERDAQQHWFIAWMIRPELLS